MPRTTQRREPLRARAKGSTPHRRRRAAASAPADSLRADRLFAAETAYACSIVTLALGDVSGSIDAMRRSHAALPTYAPALLGLGSVEYQLGRRARGRKLFFALLDLPDKSPDLCEIIDQAGDFLIQSGRYAEGLALYRRAAVHFAGYAAFHQGIACCAGHEGLHEEAVAASREALRLEPGNQRLVNDLGWSLHMAGQLEEALSTLERAAAIDPDDDLAAGNLRLCRRGLESKGARGKAVGSIRGQ